MWDRPGGYPSRPSGGDELLIAMCLAFYGVADERDSYRARGQASPDDLDYEYRLAVNNIGELRPTTWGGLRSKIIALLRALGALDGGERVPVAAAVAALLRDLLADLNAMDHRP